MGYLIRILAATQPFVLPPFAAHADKFIELPGGLFAEPRILRQTESA